MEELDKNLNKFREKFDKLPEDLQEVYAADETASKIVSIGKKHGLGIDKIGILNDEISNLILGENRPEDFIRNIASKLQVDTEKAKLVANDVNREIFQPIRDSLKKIYSGKTTTQKKEEQKSPPAPPTLPIQNETPTFTHHPLPEQKTVPPPMNLPTEESLEKKDNTPQDQAQNKIFDNKKEGGGVTIFAKKILPTNETTNAVDETKKEIKNLDENIKGLDPDPTPTNAGEAKNALEDAIKKEAPTENPVDIQAGSPAQAGKKDNWQSPYSVGKDPYREPLE